MGVRHAIRHAVIVQCYKAHMCVSLVLDHQIGEAANLELGDQEASLKKWHT